MPAPCCFRKAAFQFLLHTVLGRSFAHLSCADKLQRTQGRLQVRGVGLEIVKSTSNAGLELSRVGVRRTRRRDLVDGRHDCLVLRILPRFWS